MILEDAREFIFPIFSVEAEGNGILLASRVFLGTGFFVTSQGDAITASHVLPKSDEITPPRRLIAIIQKSNEEQVCWINHAAKFEGCDLALVKVNLNDTKYLEISEDNVPAGSDIQLIGIPNHEVWGSGKEMRILKGHVTMSAKFLELNFAIPAGMSGSPIFLESKVIGYAQGVVRSEELQDSSEELEVISNQKEQITLTKIIRMTHYGLAVPFSHLRGHVSPIFDGKTFLSYIQSKKAMQ